MWHKERLRNVCALHRVHLSTLRNSKDMAAGSRGIFYEKIQELLPQGTEENLKNWQDSRYPHLLSKQRPVQYKKKWFQVHHDVQ
jgi:hypothetical protein